MASGRMSTSPLTLGERLGIHVKVVSALAMGLGHAFHYPFLRGPKPPLTITFNNAIVRTLVSMFTSRQLRASGMPSSKRYRHWMTAHLLAIDIEVVPSSEPGGPDASLLWMGPRWAPEHEGGKPGAKVLFFVHGGGFELPLSAGHMGFLDHVMAQLKEQGLDGDMSVAALEYGLTPDHPYPTQFRQAAEALSHLINRGVPPSSIILAGDSAGGHIILSLLGHALHPHPTVPPLPHLSSPFPAIILVSPCVSINSNFRSFHTEGSKDILSGPLFTRWINLFKRHTPLTTELSVGQYWGQVLGAPRSWWSGLGGVVSRVYVTAGECEIMRDAIVQWADEFRAQVEGGRIVGSGNGGGGDGDGEGVGLGEGVEVVVLVGAREIHDAMLNDFEFPTKLPLKHTTRVIVEWIISAVRG